LHIDGTVQLFGGGTDTSDTGIPPVNCAGCHGAGDNPAPPPDTQGRSDTTLRSVGAHATHVLGTADAAAVPCAECHPVPVGLNDGSHLDGTVDFTFGPLARVGNHAPTWDPGAATCAETACHARGGTVETPVWTQVDGTQAACGTCHAIPPASPHPAVGPTNCAGGGCHDSAIVGPGPTILDPTRHVDGRFN
ncbi:MAG: CxxxxCH/CxxCH domain-containing protein, partial [Myxococcales bacterium]|nr:CxxxxCH/CxxCH domain-containing protein [Myxococcales bacterium]